MFQTVLLNENGQISLDWCKTKNIIPELEQMTTKQLSFNKQNLFRFNAEARMKDKRDYSKSALIQFRHGIERYLNNPLFKGAINRNTSNPLFTWSIQMLDV